ncbi:MAG TPA: hypothetical protein PKC24_08755 [Cyclobacteriaceae bacterium]|nr:hypothetical protein [Cyclobacteriaceae bacterium]
MEILLAIAFLTIFYLANRFIFSLKGKMQLIVQLSVIGTLLLWFWISPEGNLPAKVLVTVVSLGGLFREFYKFKAEQLEQK